MENPSGSRLTATVLRLALLIGLTIVLYYGSGILLPLTVAGLLAMMLSPVHDKLMAWGLSSSLAITGTVLLLLVFVGGLAVAVGTQAMTFADNWGEIQKNVKSQLGKVRESVPLGHLIPKLGDAASSAAAGEGGATGGSGSVNQLPVSRSGVMSFFSGTIGVLGDYFLMMVYIVLFLAQKSQLREFLLRRMPDDQRGETHRTINESMDIVQKYLRGRLILIAVLSVLYGVGFLVIGLDYAILLAVLAAVLSIIPYLGNIIGGLLAVAVAVATGDGMTITLSVLGVMAVAQVLESYVLLPLIVGEEVDLNPLATIVCVIGMTIVWGPVGAIVAIPIFAILRIICSHVPGLEDYAFLLSSNGK